MQPAFEKRKSEALGQPISTANSKLRKTLLFKYVRLAGDHFCYRCSKEIKTIEEFSIEHKDSWLYSLNPKKLFFDLDNIAFSHRDCNSAASKTYHPKYQGVHPNSGRKQRYQEGKSR